MNVLEIKAEEIVDTLVRKYPLTIIDFGVDMQEPEEEEEDNENNLTNLDKIKNSFNEKLDTAVESFFPLETEEARTEEKERALEALNGFMNKLPIDKYILLKNGIVGLESPDFEQIITGFPNITLVNIKDETQIEEMSVGSVKCGANACVRLTEGTKGDVLERKEIKLGINDITREEFRQENKRRQLVGKSGSETTKHEPMSCDSIGYVTKSGNYKCFYLPPKGESGITTRQDGKKGLEFKEGERKEHCETGKENICDFPSKGFEILKEKLEGIKLDETTLPHLFQTETKLIRGLTVGEFYWMLNNVILKEHTPEQTELYYHIIRKLETKIKAMYDEINGVFVEKGLLPITIQEQHLNNVVLQELTKEALQELTKEELKKIFDSQGALLPSSVNNNESLIALEELPNNNNYENAKGGSRKIVIKSKKNNGNKNTKLKTKNLSKKYKRVKKLGLLSGGSKKNTSKNRFDYYINKVILVNIPNVKRPRYRWIVRKRSDGRIVVRVPKNNVLVRNLNDKNISDFGEESLLQKGASIYSKKI